MFDWFFNLFKKKEDETPININLTVHDLKRGYILDYDLDSWEVLAEYTYRFPGHTSKEYKLRSSSATRFLNVSDGNSLILSWSQEANINSIDGNLRSSILNNQALARVEWEGETYSIKENSKGSFMEGNSGHWDDFQSWEYVNNENTKFIYISKWADNSIECYRGDYLKEHEVSNIIPST